MNFLGKSKNKGNVSDENLKILLTQDFIRFVLFYVQALFLSKEYTIIIGNPIYYIYKSTVAIKICMIDHQLNSNSVYQLNINLNTGNFEMKGKMK